MGMAKEPKIRRYQCDAGHRHWTKTGADECSSEHWQRLARKFPSAMKPVPRFEKASEWKQQPLL